MRAAPRTDFAAALQPRSGWAPACFVHVAAAALGLSALITSSAAAFALLRWVGAAYLVWLGIGLLRGADESRAAADTSTMALTWARSFAQGFLTNALNPKVALFFLAFLPQFIDPATPHKAVAFVALGAVFAFNGTIINVVFAALVARLRGALGAQPALGRWLGRGVGALFVALGVRLVWFDVGSR